MPCSRPDDGKFEDVLLPLARERKMGVIAMKTLGRGSLAGRVDECLQFILAQDCVDCLTIGGESRERLAELLKKIPAASVRG